MAADDRISPQADSSAKAEITTAAVSIGSGDVLFASQFSIRGIAVNLAGVAVDFTGTDPATPGTLRIHNGSFDGASVRAGMQPGGIDGRIIARGLVTNTGSIDASGNPYAPGHLTIAIAHDSAFVQQGGGTNLFFGGSLTVEGKAGASFVNDATLDSTGGLLSIDANLSGTGTIIDGVAAGSNFGSVKLSGVVEAGQTIDMSGATGQLELDRPQSFLGTIAGFNGVDVLDLKAGRVTGASFDAARNDLTLFHAHAPADLLHMTTSAPALYVTNTGGGGVEVSAAPFGPHDPTSLLVPVHPMG